MFSLRWRFLPWLILLMLAACVMSSWLTHGVMYDLTRSDFDAGQRVERLQQFFRSAGVWAPAAYVLFVTIEVIIAPIPGLLLYAPGGLIFGPWLGGALALLGNVIGSGISCGLTRSFGSAWIGRLDSGGSVSRLQAALDKRGGWVIVLLRLNPLTSTDLLSYAAGFTRIPVSNVMLATGLGMAPLCFAQSWLSDSLFNKWPQLLWPLLGLTLVYAIVVTVIVARLLRRKPADASVL